MNQRRRRERLVATQCPDCSKPGVGDDAQLLIGDRHELVQRLVLAVWFTWQRDVCRGSVHLRCRRPNQSRLHGCGWHVVFRREFSLDRVTGRSGLPRRIKHTARGVTQTGLSWLTPVNLSQRDGGVTMSRTRCSAGWMLFIAVAALGCSDHPTELRRVSAPQASADRSGAREDAGDRKSADVTASTRWNQRATALLALRPP